MKDDYTHISVILDRSGSMESIRDDTIGGFNAFLDEQKQQPGRATLTLVQFDTQDSYEVIHDFKSVLEIGPLRRETYVPRACTPLFDAMGRGIYKLYKRISDLPEEARPSKVVFAVVTDGQENSSCVFNRMRIARIIKELTEKDRWQFIFLSADLGAIDDAISVGIAADSIHLFAKNKFGTRSAWSTLSRRTSENRITRNRRIGFV